MSADRSPIGASGSDVVEAMKCLRGFCPRDAEIVGDEIARLHAELQTVEIERDLYLEELAGVFPGSTYNDKWEAIRRG
jgi:hypothetical protein